MGPMSIEQSASVLRNWWYEAMTDPNPAHRALALERLRAFSEKQFRSAGTQEERFQVRITESILAFVEEVSNPDQPDPDGPTEAVSSCPEWVNRSFAR